MRTPLPVIAVSLTALAAGTLLGAHFLTPPPNEAALATGPSQSPGSLPPERRVDSTETGGKESVSDLARTKALLQRNQFSDRQIALMMLALIEHGVSRKPAERANAENYWQRDFDRAPDTVNVKLPGEAGDEIRSALIELFGDSARDRTEFREWFYPLDAAHSYLSSSKQIQLQDIKDRHRQQLEALRGGAYTNELRRRMAELDEEMDVAIRSLLSPAELDQYRLRVTPLANRLRRTLAGVHNLSREEFDEIFEIYDSLDAGVSNPAVPQDIDQMIANDMVRDLLGPDRYQAFERGRDPVFGLLNELASRHGVTDKAIDQAYERTRRLRETARTVLSNSEYSQSERNRRYRELMYEAARDLERLIGKEAAEELMSSGSRMIWINATQG